MKLLEKKLDKDAKGHVKLVPENAEDLWQLYNIAAAGDAASGVTMRKISKDNAAGGKDTERIKVRLTLDVESVEFDQEGEELRIKGRNTTENEHIRLGAYHTLELTPGRALSIRKDNWDAVHLEVIEAACNPAASADLAVVLVTEGLANVILVGGSCTLVRAKVEKSMPRKRGAAMAGYEKALNTFLENTLQAVLRCVDFSIVRCLVLAGPGFTKEQLHRYMLDQAVKRDLKELASNKSRIIEAHASSAFKHSLKDVLSSPTVMTQIKDTKAAAETRAMEEFYSMLVADSARAFYG